MLKSEQVLTVEQRAAVGTVAVETTYLEFYIERLIQRLLGIDEHPQAELLTDRLGLTQKLDVLHDLGRARLAKNKQQQQEWSDYVANLRRLIDHRNVIVHGIWLLSQPSRQYPNPTPSAVRLRPKGIKTFEVDAIRKVAEDIDAAKQALEVFEKDYLFAEE